MRLISFKGVFSILILCGFVSCTQKIDFDHTPIVFPVAPSHSEEQEEKGESEEEVTFQPLQPSSDFIAVFGDIQFYTTSPRNVVAYKNSVKWLLYQLKWKVKFNCVLQTGDITQTNAPLSWELFEDATKELADSLLYVTMTGDHDYIWDDGVHITDRLSTKFNEFVSFPKTKERVIAEFEPGRMENVVIQNTIHGERYDFLVLEFGPRKEVVQWAKDYVSSHKDVKFILLNHEYLESGGGLRTKNLKCRARLLNTTYTTPTELWKGLISCNDNIVCVLCGHVGSLYSFSLTKNDFGREVPQIEHNIQGAAYREDNWLMLWEIPEKQDSISVSIVNTRSGKFYRDTTSLFRFQYKY